MLSFCVVGYAKDDSTLRIGSLKELQSFAERCSSNIYSNGLSVVLTQDIDLDFIHYSIEDEAIRDFIKKLNCIQGITLEIVGDIEELKHQDYHGKSVKVRISDEEGTFVESKIDIGVHKHLELEQEEYYFFKRIKRI